MKKTSLVTDLRKRHPKGSGAAHFMVQSANNAVQSKVTVATSPME